MTRRYRTALIRGRCVLTVADGRSVTYESCGGYIHAVSLPNRPGVLGPQVCERLQGSGPTLSASTDAAMLRVIRREARKAFADGGEPAYLRTRLTGVVRVSTTAQRDVVVRGISREVRP